jgi:hypothetical protein
MHYQERMTFIVMNLIVTGIAALMGGTILWLLWAGSVAAVFPTAVSSGIVAEHLNWWPAVKIVWICTLLFKTTVDTKVTPPQSPASKQSEKQIL